MEKESQQSPDRDFRRFILDCVSLRLSAVSLGQQQKMKRTENHLLDLSLKYIPDTGPCGSLPTGALQKHKANK